MREHFRIHWWKYGVLLLLSVFLWCSVFSALQTPAPNQRMHILFVGSQLDAESLETELQEILPGLTQQQLLSICVDTTEAISDSLLTARCFDYDIIIFADGKMPENIGQNSFVRLTAELLAQIPAEHYTELVESDLLVYGFRADSHSRLAGFYRGTDCCYVFVSPYSVNFDTLNETGKAGDDAALMALKYLLERNSQ